MLLIPRSLAADRPAPLLVMLHGAGSSAAKAMPIVADAAEAHGVIVLAPDSRGVTWDVIRDDYGEDVAFLDRALLLVFQTCAIDPARVAIAGFSDGASYALSLGLINGALFSDIIAFSPGFALPTQTAPRRRSSSATAGRIRCCRSSAAGGASRCGCARSGHDVAYREFAGGHVVPADMVEAAFRRFLA